MARDDERVGGGAVTDASRQCHSFRERVHALVGRSALRVGRHRPIRAREAFARQRLSRLCVILRVGELLAGPTEPPVELGIARGIC